MKKNDARSSGKVMQTFPKHISPRSVTDRNDLYPPARSLSTLLASGFMLGPLAPGHLIQAPKAADETIFDTLTAATAGGEVDGFLAAATG